MIFPYNHLNRFEWVLKSEMRDKYHLNNLISIFLFIDLFQVEKLRYVLKIDARARAYELKNK